MLHRSLNTLGKLLFLIFAIATQSARADIAAPLKKPKSAAPDKKLPAKKIGKDEELDSETRQSLKMISEKYKRLQNWEATFTEERSSSALGTSTFSDGHFVFAVPNKFRYSLAGTEASDFISDGSSAWLVRYKDGRSKPAYVRHFASLKDVELNSYLFILRGIGTFTPAKEKELMRDFKITGRAVEKEIQIVLEPKHSSELAKVTLVFKQNEDVLSKAILESTLGNLTTIILKNYKILQNADAKEFKPDYPKGSKVEEI